MSKKQNELIQPFVELVTNEMKTADYGNLPWKRNAISLEAAWYRPSADAPLVVCLSAQRLGDNPGQLVEKNDLTIDASNGQLAETLHREIAALLADA